jgi:hypothetical protein
VEEVMGDWKALLQSETVPEYEAAWRDLTEKYLAQKKGAVIRYLSQQWECERERFVRPWIKDILHLGIHTTSRVKKLHTPLKDWLKVSTMDFDNLVPHFM